MGNYNSVLYVTILVGKSKDDDIDERVVQIVSLRLRLILEFLNHIKP